MDPIHDIGSEHPSVLLVRTRKDLGQSFGNLPRLIQVDHIRAGTVHKTPCTRSGGGAVLASSYKCRRGGVTAEAEIHSIELVLGGTDRFRIVGFVEIRIQIRDIRRPVR